MARSEAPAQSVPPAAGVDWDPLVQAVVAGDTNAWQALQCVVVPQLARIARSHDSMRSRGLHTAIDDINEVTTSTLERLANNDFKNLRSYLRQRNSAENARPQTFDSWMYGAADYAIREHLRRRFGRRPANGQAERRPRPSKREINTHAADVDGLVQESSLGRALGITSALLMVKIVAFAEATFSAKELQAFRLHLAGTDLAQIAETCQLESVEAAAKLVRKLNARLRYKFAT